MKIEVHVPVEQYGYASAFFDHTEVSQGSTIAQHTRETYDGIKAIFAAKASELPQKEWNRVFDGILAGTGKLAAEEWEQMSDQQKFVLNELKKSRNRN